MTEDGYLGPRYSSLCFRSLSLCLPEDLEPDRPLDMPTKPKYTNTGSIDCTTKLNLSTFRGKSAIVTGGEPLALSRANDNNVLKVPGALGLGRAHVRALTKPGYATCISLRS